MIGGTVFFLLFSLIACDKDSSVSYVDADLESTETITDKSLTLEFTTSSMGGKYAPSHILAVWVETAGGDYVRSLKVRAQMRMEYLYTWDDASGGDVTDAVTGATLSNHTTHSISWNLQSSEQVAITNGDYQIKMEMTDKNSLGSVTSLPFSYQDTIISQGFDDATYFKNISIAFTQQTTN